MIPICDDQGDGARAWHPSRATHHQSISHGRASTIYQTLTKRPDPLPATKAAGGAMNILGSQRVDPTVPARETTGLLRRARTSAVE